METAQEKKISDPSTTANKFSEYFVNIGPELAKKLPECERKFDHYLTNNYKTSFFLNPITKCEVETQIKNLSPGYDGIYSIVFRSITEEISERLSHIFNLTFLTGTIPDNLKNCSSYPDLQSK